MKKLKKVFGRTFLKKNVSFMTKIRPEDVGGVTKKVLSSKTFFFTHFQIPDLLSFRFFGPSGKVFIEVMIHPKIDENILSHEKKILAILVWWSFSINAICRVLRVFLRGPH